MPVTSSPDDLFSPDDRPRVIVRSENLVQQITKVVDGPVVNADEKCSVLPEKFPRKNQPGVQEGEPGRVVSPAAGVSSGKTGRSAPAGKPVKVTHGCPGVVGRIDVDRADGPGIFFF